MDHEDCEGHTHLDTEVTGVDFSKEKFERIFILETDHDPKNHAIEAMKKDQPKLFEVLKDKLPSILAKVKDMSALEVVILACTVTDNQYRIYLGKYLKSKGTKKDIDRKALILSMEGGLDDLDEGLANMEVNEVRMVGDSDWMGTRRPSVTFEGENALVLARAHTAVFDEVFQPLTTEAAILSPIGEEVKKTTKASPLSPSRRAELVKRFGEEAIKELEARQKKDKGV